MKKVAALGPRWEVNKHAAFGACAGFLAMSPFFGFKLDVGPIVLRPYDFFVLAFSALYFTPYLVRGRWPKVPIRPALVTYIVLNVYFVMNAVAFGAGSVAVIETVQATEMLLAYVIITRSLMSARGQRNFLATVFWLVWLIVIATVLYHVVNGEYVRYKSLEEQKLLFGFLSVLMFVVFFQSRHGGGVAVALGLMVAVMLMLLSGERKGWFAFVAAVAIIFLFGYLGKMKRRVLGRVVIIGGLGVLCLVGLIGLSMRIDYVSKQFESLSYWTQAFSENGQSQESTLSNEKRRLLMEAGTRAVIERPVFGIGAGGFPEYMASAYFASEEVEEQGMHNEYLRYAAETGMIGLGLFVAMWLFLLADLATIAQRRHGLSQEEQFFAIFATLCVAYAAFIQFFLSAGAATYMFVVLSISTTAVAYEKAVQNKKPRHMGFGGRVVAAVSSDNDRVRAFKPGNG